MPASADEPPSAAKAVEDLHLVTRTVHTPPVQSEEYTIVQTGLKKECKAAYKSPVLDEEEPLIDTTTTLPKNSKKTRRLQKQQQKRQQKASTKVRNFLGLPAELLQEILGHLRASDVLRVSQLNHATRDFVRLNETSISRDLIDRRYWVLSRCFPLPKLFAEVDEQTQAALLNPRREKAEVHKRTSYQHIKAPNNQHICTCASCLLAWINLNTALDLSHWQHNLNHREPIPMVARGTQPKWNTLLMEKHAGIVERAVASPLCYAMILEKHLNSIVGTLLRQTRYPPRIPMHRHNKAVPPAKTVHPISLYHISEADATDETDSFLERHGKESYEVPFSRDNYYNNNMLAYVPNRKWLPGEKKWVYYAAGGHERDLEYARKWLPVPTSIRNLESNPAQAVEDTESRSN